MIKQLFLFTILISSFFAAGKEIKLSPKGGVFLESFYVKMSSDSASAIYYTIDGSIPSSLSIKYVDSILIQDVTVLRAATFINGKRSEINTQSYFVGRSYTLPIVSVVSEPNNFWSYGKGIYEKGCCADSTMPYYNANFWKSWEYRCNVEMYTAEGKKCFNQLAGMSLFGGYSRMLPQKSLAIIARSKYGKKRFKHQIFNERKSKEYKSFIIRNSGGDFKRTQLRDAFMTQLAKPTGVAIQAYEPAIIYLNGKYWGIQNLREKISEHYLEANFNVDKDKVDILRHNGVKRHGYSKSYKFLKAFLRTNDLADDKMLDSLSRFMNLHDYIRYNVSEVYSDNKDAGGNIRYFKERKPGAKWRWIFYDLDMGLSNDDKTGYASNTLKKFTTLSNEVWPNPAWSTFIIRSLLKNKGLQNQYINTFCDYLNTCYHSDTAVALLNKMAKRIELEIPFHQKRWKTSVKNWERNIEIIKEFVQKRPQYLFKHLDEKFGLDTLIQVSVKVPEDDLCSIKLNSIDIEKDFKGQYFTDVPQSITVNPKHDYKLVGWKNRRESSETIIFTPIEDQFFEPIIKAKDSSTYQHKIILNEVNFKQMQGDSTGDWIELYNMSDNPIDISGWMITDKSYSRGFNISEGVIKSGSYLIISENKMNLVNNFDLNANRVIGHLGFRLSKQGEFLKLYDSQGLIVDFAQYDTSYRKIDSAFSLGLTVPDSLHNNSNCWIVQKPSPLAANPSYLKGLAEEKAAAEARKKKAMIFVVAGAALVLGLILLFFIRKRKKRNAMKEASN